MISPRNPPSNLLYFLAAWLPSDWIVSKKEEAKILPFMDRFGDMLLETGYLHIQATKPDTVGKIC